MKLEPRSYSNTVILSTIPHSLTENDPYSLQKGPTLLGYKYLDHGKLGKDKDRRRNYLDLIWRYSKHQISSKSALEKNNYYGTY